MGTSCSSLLAVLDRTQGLLTRLTELAGHKLDRLRSADADGLQRGAAAESALLDELLECGRTRHAVLTRLAQHLHWPQIVTARLSQIADRVPQPFASRIHAKNAALRAIATQLEKKNRLAAAVARGLHKHVRAIFDELTKSARAPVGYGRTGREEQAQTQLWVDAVG
ncbi:MAG: flagellar export chaperone FlgN [Phycisphaerae bacterium]